VLYDCSFPFYLSQYSTVKAKAQPENRFHTRGQKKKVVEKEKEKEKKQLVNNKFREGGCWQPNITRNRHIDNAFAGKEQAIPKKQRAH